MTDGGQPIRSSTCARSTRTPSIAARAYLRWLVPSSLLLGAVLRIREWLFERSLWLDEVTVTTQIVARNYAGLVQPLGGNQGGPVGWLWAEKASISLFGVNELALRLPPLLASLVALAVFPLVMRRMVGQAATPAATFLVATSPVLIYYASETKQYSSDTACALLAILITTILLDRPPTLRSSCLWGVACGLLAWCSQPAILVAGACAACLVLRWLRERALLQLAAGLVVLGGSLGAEWLLTLRQLAANQALEAYWQKYGGYPPPRATVRVDLGWMKASAITFVHGFGQYALPAVALVLAAWGLLTIARLQPWRAVLLTLVVLAAVAAAVTRHYPLAQRLALYLVPVLVILMCGGLADAALRADGLVPPRPWLGPADVAPPTEGWPLPRPWRRQTVELSPGVGLSLPRPWRQLTVALSVVVLVVTTLPAVGAGIAKLWRPDEVTAARQVIGFVAAHRQPSDVVLTDLWGLNAFGFYGPREGVRQNGLVAIRPPGPQPCAENPLTPLAGRSRVWLVLVHHPSNEPPDRDAIYASQFEAHATVLLTYRGAGDVAAYLFDLNAPPASPQPPRSPWVAGGCFTVSGIGR